jgi:DNA-binding NarL/FixJ family response regulator
MTPPDTENKIRVLLIEDNQLTRLGVSTLLASQPDLSIVGEAEDGSVGIALYKKLQPDVALVDLRLPVFDGVQVMNALKEHDPSARVLILTHYDGDENIFRALRAGALGYLTKDAPGEQILAGVRAVAKGQRYVPNEILQQLAERTLYAPLTPREQQILEHLSRAESSRAIADALGISERTATTHIGNLLGKLGAKTRAEAVRVARSRGLLGADR